MDHSGTQSTRAFSTKGPKLGGSKSARTPVYYIWLVWKGGKIWRALRTCWDKKHVRGKRGRQREFSSAIFLAQPPLKTSVFLKIVKKMRQVYGKPCWELYTLWKSNSGIESTYLRSCHHRCWLLTVVLLRMDKVHWSTKGQDPTLR